LHTKISFVTKLFIWSLIFESLLYFVLGSQQYTGISLSLGRGIQIITILFLLILNKKVTFSDPFQGHFRWFTYLFLFSIFSAIIGLFTQGYLLKNISDDGFAISFFSKFIRSSMVRPFFEYLIFLYYIIYFIVMPFYLIKTEAALFYFFNMFRKMFLIGLFIGLLDLVTLKLMGIQFLGRDILDGVTVGFRYHGFAGEPRDAFVYVFYSLCVFNLVSIYKNNKPINKKYNLGLVALMLLTQSASGLIGLLIGIFLIMLFLISQNFKKFIEKTRFLILGIIIIGLGILTSDRILSYLDAFTFLLEALENEIPPPFILQGQMSNIFPIWDLYHKALNFNILPLFFGSGFGSASVANNNFGYYFLESELRNPAAQIIRVLYETGILGLSLYIITFYKLTKSSVKWLSLPNKNFLILSMLMLIGLNLGHRSTSLFIYSGLLFTTFSVYSRKLGLTLK